MRSNILMIAYTYYITDARVIKEAEAATQSGFNVDFLSLRRPHEKNGKIVVNGVRVYKLKQCRYRGNNSLAYQISYLEFFIRCFFKLSLLFIRQKYVIIHVNNMPDFMVFCTFIPKLFGAKIILDIHDPMPHTFLTKFKVNKSSLYYKFLFSQEKWSARFADSVITVHEPLKNEILVQDGIPEEKISVVANFADDRIFKVAEPNYQNGKLKFIFHGTIAERFGLDIVMEAISNLKDKRNFSLKIIGEGDYEERLHNLIEVYELQDTVEFDNTFYPAAQLPEILKSFHIGLASYRLSPATEYMLPVKMLELWAMGIPVITVPNKAIQYYFNDDQYFAYDPASSDTLTAVIEEIIQNPNLIRQKREYILQSRHNYLWSNESTKYVNVLYKLVHQVVSG